MDGFTKQESSKWCAKWGFDVSDVKLQQGRTFWRLDGSGPIIIWTDPSKNMINRMAILAHECIHAAHVCLQRAGVVPSFDNDEPTAYLVTVLMRKALAK